MTGRKLYLYWGDFIIGIEKIRTTPEMLKQLNLEDLGSPLADKSKSAHILFELVDCGLGVKIERRLGDPSPSDVGGREIQEYFTNMQYWTTPEERADGNK